MKSMKKFFGTFCFLILSLALLNAQSNIGIFAGGGVSDMRMITSDKSYNKIINKDMKFLPGYYGGFNFENILVERQLYLQFGLQATSRGFSADNDSVKYFIHQAYIPLEIKYKYFFSRRGEGYVFASAGPYAAANYKGKQTNIASSEAAAADTTGTITFSPEIKFGKLATDDFAPFDFGVNISLGYGYSHVQIAYNFSMGLQNLYPKAVIDGFKDAGEPIKKLNNMNHSLTIGFYFTNK